MLRLLIRSAVMIFLLWSGSLAAFQARPYQDDDVQALRDVMQGCSCFMGIQLGLTGGSDALAILKMHPWVNPDSLFVTEDLTRQYQWIGWKWSEQSPRFLIGSAFITYSNLEDGTIRSMRIRTSLDFGRLVLQLGIPEVGLLDSFRHIAAYPHFAITSVPVCGQFWQQDATLLFTGTNVPSPNGYPRELFPYAEVLSHQHWDCTR